MDLLHKVLTGVAIGLLGLGTFLGYEWLQAHDAAIRAEAKVAADQAAFEKLTAQQQDLKDQLAQIKKDQTDQLAGVSKQFNQAQNPQQLATLIGQIMGLKSAPVVNTPPATAANPNPTPIVELPDAPQVKEYLRACEECKVNYAAAQKAAAIAEKDKAAAEAKLELVTDERDQWKDTAKGGSWKKRAGNRILNFFVDAGILIVAACGTGHCR